MKKITVIVPFYNVQEYISECLESIANQTLEKSLYEVFLVDDGSQDNSLNIVENFIKDGNDNFKLLKKKNGGLASARNFALNKTRTEYVVFVDSDDYLESNYLMNLFNTIESEKCDIVSCKYNLVYKDPSIINILKKVADGFINNDHNGYIKPVDIQNFKYVAWNKIYKSSLFNDIKFIDGTKHEDIIINLFLMQDKKIFQISDKLYNYRQREDSLNKKPTQTNLDDIDTNYKYVIENIKNENYISMIKTKWFISKSVNLFAMYKDSGNTILIDKIRELKNENDITNINNISLVKKIYIVTFLNEHIFLLKILMKFMNK